MLGTPQTEHVPQSPTQPSPQATLGSQWLQTTRSDALVFFGATGDLFSARFKGKSPKMTMDIPEAHHTCGHRSGPKTWSAMS
jgi:hypothetical protein